jgi:AcrR family transcriptional regulator
LPWDNPLLELRLANVYDDNMAKKDNSVNIEAAKRSYHHGDLRSSLVAAGLELLKERAADDLSLREVARHVGVSATAVYRHFPDKQALFYAMCREGGEELARVQLSASQDTGGARAGFEASGRAYINFALANPALYRLMMSTRPPIGFLEEDDTAVGSAMHMLKENVADMLSADASELENKVAALHSWALVHGISMLILDGLVKVDGPVLDALLRIPSKADRY